MWAWLRTEHGRKNRWGFGGLHPIHRSVDVTAESVHIMPSSRGTLIEIRTGYEPDDVEIGFGLDELRALVAVLREKGIEVDPDREKLRALHTEMGHTLGAVHAKVPERAS